MRWLSGLVVLVFRGDQAKDAELLVRRHENVVLRRAAGPDPVRGRRPGLVRCAGPVHPAAAGGRGLPGDVRDAPGLAPQPGRADVRHEHAPPARPPGIVAVDFLHVDTVLLTRLYVLVFIEPGTRRMHLGGVTASPAGEWTVQQARNLALNFGERFEDVKFLIRDRGSNFTASFDAVFQAAGTRIIRTAVQAPRMNATCERLVGTLRRELLDRMLILGAQHLHAILTEYQAHYNPARPHQGIAQRVPDDERDAPRASVTSIDTQQIRRKPVLGGLINEYTHAA